MSRWSVGLVLVLLSACGGGGDDSGPTEGTREATRLVGPQAPQRREGQDQPWFAPEPRRADAREQSRSTGGYSIDLSQRETARLFYNTVYKASDGISSGWTGSISGCVAGDTSAAYKDAVLRRINWFRAMAGLPANVQLDATFNRKAQQAALVMAANKSLSHNPPSAWTCNNAEATEAAGSSNLALGNAGADSIAVGYMEDAGSNNTAVGHRRWILYPQTQTMGTGDVTGSTSTNALWVFDNRFGTPRPSVRDEFVAWPPPGYVPYTTVYPRWSFSYPNADFSSATVSMSENGVSMPTRKETLSSGMGENTLVWMPGTYSDGMTWARPSDDTVYTVQINGVKINGIGRHFNYTVKVFDPEVATQILTLTGNSTATVGQSSNYSFSAFPGANAYQWRSLEFSMTPFTDGAEGDLSQFTTSTTTGYSVQATGVASSGGRSFHLAHPQPVDQVLMMQGDWVPTAQTNLRFASRLALASSGQRARVEVSTDDGVSWNSLFEQAGAQTGSTSSVGEAGFSPKQISLAAYEGRTIKLRFVYKFVGGSYYPQTSNNVGWFIDDVALDAVNRITQTSSPTNIGSSTQFSITPNQIGGLLLQARPGMYGFFGAWGGIKAVTVQTKSNPVPVSVVVSTAAIDCFFSWAQQTFPSELSPAANVSQTVNGYRYRFYSSTGLYLGVLSTDQKIYLLQQGVLHDLGHVSTWLTQASCTHL
jgi:uncharacterized protein YkwD